MNTTYLFTCVSFTYRIDKIEDSLTRTNKIGFNFMTSKEYVLLKILLDGHFQSWLRKGKRFFYKC